MAHATPMIGGGSQVSASREERGPKRKRVRHIHLGKAEGGGFTADHEYASPPGGPFEPNKMHAFGPTEGHKVVEHVAKHMRIRGSWTPSEEPEGAGAGESAPVPGVGKAAAVAGTPVAKAAAGGPAEPDEDDE